jgi:hypothetical protein
LSLAQEERFSVDVRILFTGEVFLQGEVLCTSCEEGCFSKRFQIVSIGKIEVSLCRRGVLLLGQSLLASCNQTHGVQVELLVSLLGVVRKRDNEISLQRRFIRRLFKQVSSLLEILHEDVSSYLEELGWEWAPPDQPVDQDFLCLVALLITASNLA